MPATMPLAHVKAQLSEVVDGVIESHDRVTITRHGRREAVVIAASDLDALGETLDLLSDPEAMQEMPTDVLPRPGAKELMPTLYGGST